MVLLYERDVSQLCALEIAAYTAEIHCTCAFH